MERGPEVAWAKRYRLNELADRLEQRLDSHLDTATKDESLMQTDALRHIAINEMEAEEFIEDLRALIRFIRLYYPREE